MAVVHNYAIIDKKWYGVSGISLKQNKTKCSKNKSDITKRYQYEHIHTFRNPLVNCSPFIQSIFRKSKLILRALALRRTALDGGLKSNV